MSDKKKDRVLHTTRKILAKYEIEGITKNRLSVELQETGAASRNTFYTYWDDLIKEKIVEVRKVGNQQTRCFPTKENQALLIIKENLRYLENLIRLIEKDPLVGDCFAFTGELSNIFLMDLPNKITKYFGNNSDDQLFDTIRSENPTKEKSGFVRTRIYSLSARRDILKELSTFLIYYVNNPQLNYSEQIKNEFMKMIFPYVIKSLNILRKDYLLSYSYSTHIRKEISKNLPATDAAIVYNIKGRPSADSLLEFLKILIRYYFCISAKYANMELEITEAQKIVSSFITTFYKPLILKENNDPQTNPIERLRDSLIVNNDIDYIKNFSNKLIKELGMLSKN